MSFDLDPKEVLEHLNCLGYYNISPEQFKDFMKDLKKLIRHDQNRQLRQQICQEEEYVKTPKSGSDCPDTFQYESCSESQDVRGTCNCEGCECDVEPTREETANDVCHHDHLSSSNNRRDEGCPSEEVPISNKEDQRSRSASRAGSTRKQNVPQSKPGSFIRPSTRGGVSQKCDPVALYHRYQNLWAQHPLPGEDPRANLRWNIRHKMMGAQKTQISRTASVEKMNQRPEFQL